MLIGPLLGVKVPVVYTEHVPLYTIINQSLILVRPQSYKAIEFFSAENSPTHEIENMAWMASGGLSLPLRYNTVRAFVPRDHELI